MVNTPAPSWRAAAKPFGPLAPMSQGTSIGRSGAWPSPWIMAITLPSISTSSPRSSACTCCTYSTTSAQRIGFCPRARRPVKPEPMAYAVRPAAIDSSVAMAEAVVSGWRRLGISTAGPSPMVDVAWAHSARCIHTSSCSAGVSYSQTRS